MKHFFQSNLFRFLWSAALAVFLFFVCPPCLSKTALGIVLGILLILVNTSQLISKVPFITHVFRVFVGGLFIFSGFIKANDPLGFSYKLNEYFEVFKEDTHWDAIFDGLTTISLPLAIIICASEIILGFLLLLGYKRNLTLWLLLAQIVFFTFLTFYSACYNKVTHCGCFGDFLPLKPWESFWKDVVLLVSITLLFSGRENIKPLFPPMACVSLLLLAFVFSIGFPVYAYRNLPPLDFRAYAIGMNLKDNMKPGDNYQPPVYETRFKYENLKTKEVKDFDMKTYPWQDTLNWKWVSTDNVLVKDAVNPPKIVDFSVNDLDGNPITDSLLNIKGYNYLLICYDLTKTDDDETLQAQINDFYKLASQEHIPFTALTASGAEEMDAFRKKHHVEYRFANTDMIVLKTMIRSNPGLMLMKDGTVIMNWHHNNFPSYSDAKQKYMK